MEEKTYSPALEVVMVVVALGVLTGESDFDAGKNAASAVFDGAEDGTGIHLCEGGANHKDE